LHLINPIILRLSNRNGQRVKYWIDVSTDLMIFKQKNGGKGNHLEDGGKTKRN
jgi:hypothetical protein